jgi:FkbM family methyltransferase
MRYKPMLRNTLRQVVRLPMPGRYLLVELLSPLLVEPSCVEGRSYGGLRFACDLSDLLQRQIFFGLYEPEDVALLSRLIDPGAVVCDIGGNVGLYTLIAARLAGERGQVHVFEPVPANVAAIERNLALNGLSARVVVNPLAVANQPGMIELFLPGEAAPSGWASLVPSADRSRAIVVPTIDLDSYMAQRKIAHVDLVKLDIEGAELLALRGMAGLLGGPRPPLIYVELNPYFYSRQGIDPATLKRLLASFGYQLFAYNGGQLRAVSPHAAEPRLRNLLAIPSRGQHHAQISRLRAAYAKGRVL